MIATSTGVVAAIGLMVVAFAALAAGIGMVVWGIIQLQKNKAFRAAETRMVEEHAKAVEGVANEYMEALEAIEMLGYVLSEGQREYIKLEKERRAAMEEHLALVEDLGENYIELQNAAAQALYNEKVALWEANIEAERHLNIWDSMVSAMQKVANASEVYFGAGGIREQLIETGIIKRQTSLKRYDSGGPILGPTVLSSLSTGRPYAIAGESGKEVVSSGGGYQTANIVLEIDGVAFARVAGVPIVDEIRLKTGVRL